MEGAGCEAALLFVVIVSYRQQVPPLPARRTRVHLQ